MYKNELLMTNYSYIMVHLGFNNLSLVAEVEDERLVLSYHSLTIIILCEYTCSMLVRLLHYYCCDSKSV